MVLYIGTVLHLGLNWLFFNFLHLFKILFFHVSFLNEEIVQILSGNIIEETW